MFLITNISPRDQYSYTEWSFLLLGDILKRCKKVNFIFPLLIFKLILMVYYNWSIWFIPFVWTEFSETFMGNRPCQVATNNRRFGRRVGPYYQDLICLPSQGCLIYVILIRAGPICPRFRTVMFINGAPVSRLVSVASRNHL